MAAVPGAGRSAGLPVVGVMALVAGKAAFDAAMKGVNKSISASVDTAKNAARQLTLFGMAVSAMQKPANIMATAMSILKTAIMGIIGVIAGAIAALTGMLALAGRASRFRGVAESFDKITASAGILSVTLLNDMRRAAAGTISDFNLMRGANLALAGATGEFATEFGRNLPKLLEIARVQSRATGQSVEYLYDSLVAGIKRSSPRLIDNTGIMVRLTEVNQRYAQQMGITVEQMSAQDRQMALLQATVEAGNVAIEAAGGIQETLADKFARANASISNILDRLGVAFEPVAMVIMTILNNILTAISNFLQHGLRYIAAFGQIIADILGPIIASSAQTADQLNDPGLVQRFFTGGAKLLGSWMNGIMYVANTYLFPAIIQIAQTIADFLVGMSPPPEGPLSQIDKGGRNTMLAWLEGFTGVGMEPVKKVAAQVNDFMGDIAKYSMSKTEAALARLDAAIQPFQDRLEIIKNTFESIAEPAKAAIEGINRMLETAVQAMVDGQAGAVEVVKNLDRQREKIENYLDANQGVLDSYQIQLALLKAQQEPQRTLLNIQLARLKAEEQAKEAAAKKKAAAKPKKGPKGKESPAIEDPTGGAEPIAPGTPGSNVLDSLGLGAGDVAGAKQEIMDAFASGFDPSNVEAFQGNRDALQAQLDRIKGVDIGANIAKKLQELPGKVGPIIQDFIGSITDPNREGSIPYVFNHLGETMGPALTDITNKLQEWVNSPSGPGQAIRDWADSISNPDREGSIPWFFNSLWANISPALTTVGDSIKNWIDTAVVNVTNAINAIVNVFLGFPAAVGSAISSFGQAIYGGLIVPLIGLLNSAIAALESFLNSSLQSMVTFVDNFSGVLNAFPGGSAVVLAANELRGRNPIQLGRISLPPMVAPANAGGGGGGGGRASRQPTAAASGGLFGAGALTVGERGREVVASANRMAVFPHSFLNSMWEMRNGANTPSQAISNNYSYDNSHTVNANFYGSHSPSGVMQRLNLMKAYR